MHDKTGSEHTSVFRSHAWVQAWIDTWGKHPGLRLMDLGGSANPLECVYITRTAFKKIIPASCLCLAGTGFGKISTPRAEYNNLNALLALAGSYESLMRLLAPLPWNLFSIPDVISSGVPEEQVLALAQEADAEAHIAKREMAYSVNTGDWQSYLSGLGANTRLSYFNRRKNLSALGQVDRHVYSLDRAHEFFVLLNQFHCLRWGSPCYAVDTQAFMVNLGQRLKDEQGQLLLESLTLNGKVISVLVDIEWQGVRYNLQSGYYESKYPKIALGALHMGYAIEDAIYKRQIYDFMAGFGKNINYKARIATQQQLLKSYQLERGWVKKLRQLQRILHPRETPS